MREVKIFTVSRSTLTRGSWGLSVAEPDAEWVPLREDEARNMFEGFCDEAREEFEAEGLASLVELGQCIAVVEDGCGDYEFYDLLEDRVIEARIFAKEEEQMFYGD